MLNLAEGCRLRALARLLVQAAQGFAFGTMADAATDKSLLVLFFRKEQERKTLLFLKKKKQKDLCYRAGFG
jgi:hypothetical protein